MQTIGITGGIGSGKSTVAHMLETMGFQVYVADREAKRLMDEDPRVRRSMSARFGNDIYTPEGSLDKTRLSGIIFKNKQVLEEVNHIVHPCVMEDFRAWSNRQDSPLVFFESAIIFEADLNRFFDAIICVTAPLTIRMQRVMKRDGATSEQINERISNQLDDALKCRQSDFIIYNDGQHPLIAQVITVIGQIQKKD